MPMPDDFNPNAPEPIEKACPHCGFDPDEERYHMAHFNAYVHTIPHGMQRYDTVGDWLSGDVIGIRVSELPDERYEFLVGLHELVEAYLCRARGISEESVTAYDNAFEALRKSGELLSQYDEPGDDPRAPYHHEHVFATKLERMMADELGVDWDAYANAIEELSK